MNKRKTWNLWWENSKYCSNGGGRGWNGSKTIDEQKPNLVWKKKKKIKKKANQRENRKTKSSTQQRERKHGILAKIVIVKRTGAPQKGGAKNNEIQRINFNC